jgi:hypothetical protein
MQQSDLPRTAIQRPPHLTTSIQMLCIRVSRDNTLSSDNRPATSDNSKSPQDAAIRYEPAAAVNFNSKTKPQMMTKHNILQRAHTSVRITFHSHATTGCAVNECAETEKTPPEQNPATS